MQHIYSGELNAMEYAQAALSPMFDICTPTIVDANGRLLMLLNGSYFFNSNGTMFPITNNLQWHGDFYNSDGTIACTATELHIARRLIPRNKQVWKEFSELGTIESDVARIISLFLMDYFVSLRAYEVSGHYTGSLSESSDYYREATKNNDFVMDDYQQRMFKICQNVLPGAVDAISEYTCSEEGSYAVLNISHHHGCIYIDKIDDWRIREWKRLTSFDETLAEANKNHSANPKVSADIIDAMYKRKEVNKVNQELQEQFAKRQSRTKFYQLGNR